MITLEYTEHTLTIDHADISFKVIVVVTPVKTIIESINPLPHSKEEWREIRTPLKVDIKKEVEQMAKRYISQLHGR